MNSDVTYQVDHHEVLVSICIPTYNNARHARQAIESALNQTYRNVEVIVVDDASTDNTWDIVRSINDARLRCVRNEHNLGAPGNWHKAVLLAKGEFTKILCGDDVLEPDCIAHQVAAFASQRAPEVALVASRREFVSNSGQRVHAPNFQIRAGRYSARDIMKKSVRAGTNIIGEPMAVLFRTQDYRDRVTAISGNLFMMDLELYSDLLGGQHLYMLDTTDCLFRLHDQSLSSSIAWRQISAFHRFIAKLRQGGQISGVDALVGGLMATVLATGRWAYRILYPRSNRTNISTEAV